MTLRRDRKRMKKKWKPNLTPSVTATCRNCGEKGPHFIPPCFGDLGFYMCTPKPNGADVDG